MGDVVMRRRSARWQRWVASAAVLIVVAGVGCTASKPARVVEAAPVSARDAAAETRAAASTSAEIRSLDLREGAPETFVDLEASAPLVWTSFRNAEGRVVVELPNAVPGSQLADLAPEEGLVSSLDIQRSEEGSRPLTRLVIATRQEAEHSITAEGSKLRIQLMPIGEQGAAKLAFEPLGEETAAVQPPAGSSEPAPAPAEPAEPAAVATGTPDRPAVAPAPAGVAATRLDGIEVLAADGGAVIRLFGDGEFPYSTFALSEPQRFVVDLDGVINRSARSALAVESSVVERVRVAQFKPAPRPVSRVVFDLRRPTVPAIERTADALVISFPGAGTAPPAAAAVPPAAPLPATPSPSAPPPSDLTLAQTNRAPAIEMEEASPMPAPAPTQPPQVQVTPARPPAGSQPGAVPRSDEPVDVTSAVPSPASPLRSVAAGAPGERQRVYVGEPIDLKVTNADVTDVLRTFAQISGLNIIVQPGVTGTVTAELENVPWDQALEQVLKINNLDYELDGNVMRIAPTSVLRQEAQERQQLQAAKALAIPLRTVYQRLSYADAAEVARLLRAGAAGGILSQRGSVVVDRRTNAIIIKELPTNMDAVLSVVDLLDKPEPQVMIEARIVEATKRFTRDLGIDWGIDGVADAAHGNTTGLVFPSNITATGRAVTGGSGANFLNLRLGNVLNTFVLDATLRAAENEGLISILSAPKVATLNNRRASIQSGLQIPVQTILNNTVTVQFINVTLRLDVVPQVTAEGTVLMEIDISKKEPAQAFLLPGATNAPIATKDARTQLLVRDGGTAVIGGIYRVTGNYGDNRIPGLSNIPIIGHLFRNKTRAEENEELLIFITPRIIKI
jgi:type IV pilus assembly protein PilQ